MKKLTWKKKKFGSDMIVWIAMIKTVGWEFSIEKTSNGYESFIYYGCGEDMPLLNGFAAKDLKEAQNICNNWLHNTILGLNKWI